MEFVKFEIKIIIGGVFLTYAIYGLLLTGTDIPNFKHAVILDQTRYLLSIKLSQRSVRTISFFITLVGLK
jgi:hypothetical protein